MVLEKLLEGPLDCEEIQPVHPKGNQSWIFIERKWHLTPVFLPGKSHVQRSMVGYSPRSFQESDMTEQLHFHFLLSCIGEGNGNPLQCSCLENPRDGGAWWAAVSGVSQSRTRLKRLSSSSSRVSLTLQQFKILIFSNQPDFFFMASGFWVLLWKPFPAQEHYIYIDR